jgi:hypothetical protein
MPTSLTVTVKVLMGRLGLEGQGVLVMVTTWSSAAARERRVARMMDDFIVAIVIIFGRNRSQEIAKEESVVRV